MKKKEERKVDTARTRPPLLNLEEEEEARKSKNDSEED